MPNPTAAIDSASPNARRMTNAITSERNPDFVFTGNANVAHTPAFFVGIFNVSDQPQTIERPWVSYNPAMRTKAIVIPAKLEGERVSKPFLINDVVQIPIRNISNGEMDTRGQDGKFLAQDALNPEDPRGSWKTVKPVNAGFAQNEGTNLYLWGLFWEVVTKRDDPPSEDAVEAAIRRMEENYNRLIEEAKVFWMGGDQGKRQIGNTHRRAASYFELEFEWNQIYKSRVTCEGCGAKIPKNIAACPNCNAILNEEKARKLWPERFLKAAVK